jgi:hypothetical protein
MVKAKEATNKAGWRSKDRIALQSVAETDAEAQNWLKMA